MFHIEIGRIINKGFFQIINNSVNKPKIIGKKNIIIMIYLVYIEEEIKLIQ